MSKKTRKKTPSRVRVNMRWPTEMTTWLRKKAERENTNVTQLCVDHWTREMQREQQADGNR